MSARHRRRGPSALRRLRERLNALPDRGRSHLLASGLALGSAAGLTLASLLERRQPQTRSEASGRHARSSLPLAPLDSPSDLSMRDSLTREVTGECLLAAWQDSSTGSVTTINDMPASADLEDAPVRLLGEMDGFSFWIGADADSPLVLRVQAVWDRTLPAESADPLRRAINDWNRDHVWPLVWLIESHTGYTVGAGVSMDLAHGATHQQLVDFLDISLAAIDKFFTALNDATPSTETDEDADPDRL